MGDQSRQTQGGLTGLEVAVAFVVLVLLILCFVPVRTSTVAIRSRQILAQNNARQLLASLKLYAADHGGAYPEAGCTSNAVFRLLFDAGILEVDGEMIFGCDRSPFVPDENIGRAPDFAQAPEPGENHWAMVAGLNDQSPGQWPVILENPVTPAWPPAWNMDAAGNPVKGRAWKSGTIIIARNDGSVEALPLAAQTGKSVPLAPDPSGKDPFTEMSPSGTILDVETR
jgi:hypothetical protein